MQVIPQLSGDATQQTPPDLPSYLFKERIVYLVSVYVFRPAQALPRTHPPEKQIPLKRPCLQGMSLVPSVTELLLAEFLYLQYDNPTAPIYMYINSAGVQVSTGLS